jgi:membrane protein implicated in regulation of membrane protease activity
MPILVRYWLFQIPEMLALGSLGGLLVWLDYLAWYWVLALIAADLVKDALLYPWLRVGYSAEPSRLVGPERILCSRGVATEDLAPEGFVRISAELWRARTADGGRVARGTAVRVESLEGLRLVVSPDPAPQSMLPPRTRRP